MYLSETELEFYTDPYKVNTTSWVDDHGQMDDGRSYLLLGNTIFYPQGGGQKGDRGNLKPEKLNQVLTVVDTRKFIRPDGAVEVRHIVDRELEQDEIDEIVGERAELALEWGFRYQQMKLHSAAHLLHVFLEKACGTTLKEPQLSDLQPSQGVNRYDDIIIAQAVVSEAVTQLNCFLRTSTEIITVSNSSSLDGSRLWLCGEWSIPCGGVHPKSTGELNPISAVASSKKGRTSITFRLIEPMS